MDIESAPIKAEPNGSKDGKFLEEENELSLFGFELLLLRRSTQECPHLQQRRFFSRARCWLVCCPTNCRRRVQKRRTIQFRFPISLQFYLVSADVA